MKNVLVVEDDQALADLVEIHLKDLGFKVQKTDKGLEGLNRAMRDPFDLLILDLMLPDTDGLTVCRQLRMEKKDLPIIMLTARTEEIDKVLGLETGADDYITKPFSIREFQARVKAVMRRSEQPRTAPSASDNRWEFGRLIIDKENRIVTLEDKRVELTPKEFDLLALLASRPGRSYTRQDLLNQVWGYQFEGYEHTVNSHINRLRAKIENDPSDPDYVLTTWGVGYRFNDNIDT